MIEVDQLYRRQTSVVIWCTLVVNWGDEQFNLYCWVEVYRCSLLASQDGFRPFGARCLFYMGCVDLRLERHILDEVGCEDTIILELIISMCVGMCKS